MIALSDGELSSVLNIPPPPPTHSKKNCRGFVIAGNPAKIVKNGITWDSNGSNGYIQNAGMMVQISERAVSIIALAPENTCPLPKKEKRVGDTGCGNICQKNTGDFIMSCDTGVFLYKIVVNKDLKNGERSKSAHQCYYLFEYG